MKKFAAAAALAIVAGTAGASTITIQTGDGFASNLASANAYRTAVDAIVGAPTDVSSYDDLVLNLNYGKGLEGTISFYVYTATAFDFRAGMDLGGGGALFLDGHALDFKGSDMWWAGNYDDASQFLAGSSFLNVGGHTLQLYGFEDCCSGNSQVQFSTNGGLSFTSFGATDGLPPVPEAQNVAMLLAGLGLIGTLARRRAGKQA